LSGIQVKSSASIDFFEYRSKHSLLGLPLIHITGGRRSDGKVNVARGWIAFGGLAYGVLFSCGGIAVGGISFGGIAIGVVAFGGLGFGVLALAGLAAGIWAAGGAAAFGCFAVSGGCAIAWTGAQGAAAIAHDFARGSAMAMAQHANDATAETFLADQRFFAMSNPKVFTAVMGLCWLPMLFLLWQTRRAMKALRAKASSIL
jgi:hypothetical protein